ncbi:MAG: phosphate ABC transporter substrate-binding protein [Holophagaceae bacterium]|nr:phosphate ABC transporter substrate-binding protein [Holophagaceae bacterium]
MLRSAFQRLALPTLLAVLSGTSLMAAGPTYEGSTTIGENIIPQAAKAFEAKTGVKFERIGNLGSGKGFQAVMAGQVSLGGVSRALTPAEKKQNPHFEVIGHDAIAVFVNAKNPVKNLTLEQVKGIFTGRITNWKDVGGASAPINVITEFKAGGRATIAAFKELALGNAEYGPSKEVDKPHWCVRAVGADPNAITHASFAFNEPGTAAVSVNSVLPSMKAVQSNAYVISRPLILVAKGAPTGDVKRFLDFVLSPEGQQIVKRNFLPVK